jgi:hypothetical protein
LEEGVTFDLTGQSQYLGWPGVAGFRISDRSSIEVAPAPGVPDQYIAFPLLGPVMALLLHLRGMLVLHASAVEIGGKSAIFVGDKLAGKSTTAAAFLRAGHRLITDDLLAVEIEEGVARVHPAFAQLKLSSESSSAVHVEGAIPLPLVHEGFPKRQHRLSGDFSLKSLPAHRLFVLERGGARPHIELLKGIEALQAVMRFSYISRFGKEALAGSQEATHLRQCAELAGSCTVARLRVPDDLALLHQVVAMVEADLE